MGNPSPASVASLSLFEASTPAHAGVFDFLAPATNHPELDVFVNGAHDETYGLGHLFTGDFGGLGELLQDYEAMQGQQRM